jgi:hypothetical protein
MTIHDDGVERFLTPPKNVENAGQLAAEELPGHVGCHPRYDR